MYTTLVLNVDELWLKGKNRKSYFEAMKKHIRAVIKAYHSDQFVLKNEQQRLTAESETAFSEELISRLQDLPGLNSIQPVRRVELDMDKVVELVVKELKLQTEFKTFKVKAKRVNKRFSMVSNDINRYVATGVLKNTHFKVDVHNPDLMIEIKVMNDSILVSWEKLRATGGLPVGTSGKLVTLISGGFDSPVASYVMAKRGCQQTFAFFYAYPYVGEEVKEKIVKICQVLSRYQNGAKLYVIPFGDIQNYIAKECDERYRTLLFRKYMMDVSCALAYRTKSDALLMGDALGQVSSQTIHNMKALDAACPRLVMRPLLGHNKIEIIQLSKKVGTHDISIIPHDDACSLFAPKHPVIKPKDGYFEKFIEEHDCRDLIHKAISEAEIFKFDVKGEQVE
ncbi:tRNA uracil 4-sulfurtransferase ThiI [Bacteriovorax sp. DB6_IX]|uniref:tRNA uracil 4-sulfurtransferase ThiI n=2 Tax=Bacteriovorax sp. DB6_IX TaxID=1353530 RepID=UPI000389E81C|nr:tRNA uracil 4-sulfurtransferase ThiI [Bacteriovorax sp. DB6_IX]EQC50072.1 tRNA sulfurtransferase ThiI [Bacteriovorax sp. DB6_IX]